MMSNKSYFDFNLDYYKNFLKSAKRKYEIVLFGNEIETSPCLILRHDLDLSISAALKIAKIENELGIKSTFFLLLHSPFYNLLDLETFQNVQEIISLGHQIGLHFDSHFYKIKNEEDLDEKLQLEAGFLGKLFNIKINVFSFHITNEFTLSCRKKKYGGLINSYSEYYFEEFDYCSDSYGIWREKELLPFVQETESKRIQILTHPEWWVHAPGLSPEQRIQNIIIEINHKLKVEAKKNYII
jgi:hypothetical protein